MVFWSYHPPPLVDYEPVSPHPETYKLRGISSHPDRQAIWIKKIFLNRSNNDQFQKFEWTFKMDNFGQKILIFIPSLLQWRVLAKLPKIAHFGLNINKNLANFTRNTFLAKSLIKIDQIVQKKKMTWIRLDDTVVPLAGCWSAREEDANGTAIRSLANSMIARSVDARWMEVIGVADSSFKIMSAFDASKG